MKHTDLIRKLEEMGSGFVRHGGNHDWYRNPKIVNRYLSSEDQRVSGNAHPEETREWNERLPFLVSSSIERADR
jgi:hypothetical protein